MFPIKLLLFCFWTSLGICRTEARASQNNCFRFQNKKSEWIRYKTIGWRSRWCPKCSCKNVLINMHVLHYMLIICTVLRLLKLTVKIPINDRNYFGWQFISWSISDRTIIYREIRKVPLTLIYKRITVIYFPGHWVHICRQLEHRQWRSLIDIKLIIKKDLFMYKVLFKPAE